MRIDAKFNCEFLLIASLRMVRWNIQMFALFWNVSSSKLFVLSVWWRYHLMVLFFSKFLTPKTFNSFSFRRLLRYCYFEKISERKICRNPKKKTPLNDSRNDSSNQKYFFLTRSTFILWEIKIYEMFNYMELEYK